MKQIGLVAAFRWEVRPLLRSAMRNRSAVTRLRPKVYSLELGGTPAVLTISGAGSENSFRAARELAERFPLSGLATLGFAGALATGLAPGDVILGDEVLDEATLGRFGCQTDLFPVRFT